MYINNLGVLFYSRVSNNIREVVDSINLVRLVKEGNHMDDILNGECCSFISKIKDDI